MTSVGTARDKGRVYVDMDVDVGEIEAGWSLAEVEIEIDTRDINSRHACSTHGLNGCCTLTDDFVVE